MKGGGLVQALRALKILDADEVPVEVRPSAYLGPWPIRAHRTMAEVAADERRAAPQGRPAARSFAREASPADAERPQGRI